MRFTTDVRGGIRLLALLLAVVCAAAPAAWAQSALASGGWSYTAHSWQPQNGLPGETVQAFAQTADGPLWVGTSEGLARFDGEHFTVFARENTPQMRENSVFCLLAGRNQTLWIGTEGGGLVEMRGGRFRVYGAAEGLTDGFVRAIFEDRAGALWVATDNGLFRKTGEKLERIDNRAEMPANAFHAVLEDSRGRMWAGAARLYALINGQPREFKLDGTDSQNRVKSIVETEDAFHNACKFSGKMNGPNMPKIFLLRMPVVSQVDMERTVQFRAGPRNGDLAAFLVYLVNGKTMCFGKGNHLAQVFR